MSLATVALMPSEVLPLHRIARHRPHYFHFTACLLDILSKWETTINSMCSAISSDIASAFVESVADGLLTWRKVIARLDVLVWRIEAALWLAVFSPDSGKVLTGKDNTDLIIRVLGGHAAPESKSAIHRIRKVYLEDLRLKLWVYNRFIAEKYTKNGNNI
jgi:hypothetical protein